MAEYADKMMRPKARRLIIVSLKDKRCRSAHAVTFVDGTPLDNIRADVRERWGDGELKRIDGQLHWVKHD